MKAWYPYVVLITITALISMVFRKPLPAQELTFNPSQLVALYQFEGNTKDASQNQIDGMGFNIRYGEGHEGEGLVLAGNGGVRIPGAPLLQFKREFTFDGWVNSTGRSVGGCRLFELGNKAISLTLNHLGSLDFSFKPKNREEQSLRSNGDKAVLYNNRWMHVSAVLGNGLMALYIDGFEVGRKKIPFSFQEIEHTPGGLVFGNSSDSTKGFRGSLDDIRISASVSPAIPPLTIELLSYPSMGKLEISANITGTDFQDAAVRGSARLFSSVGKQPMQSINLRPFELGIATGEFNITVLPPGEYKITLVISGMNGQKLLEKSATYLKPDGQDWEYASGNIETSVPAPWVPLTSGGDTLRCLGREYVFTHAGLFPAQISAGGVSVLSAPISLRIKSNGGFIEDLSGAAMLTDSSAEKIIRSANAGDRNLFLKVQSSLEFDGMMRIDVTITPYRTIHLDTMFLDIPFRESAALYYLYYPEEWNTGVPNAGAIPKDKWESGFKPYIWIGNNDEGLCWFAESEKNWSLLKDEPVIRIIRGASGVLLRIAIINRPANLNRAFSFTFGLQASPVKPKPKEARTWRYGADINGVNIVCEWADPRSSEWYSFPKPVNPDSFASRIDSIHAKNKKVVFYSSIHYLSSCAPEWEYFEGDWWAYRAVYGQSDIVPFGHLSMPVCSRQQNFKDFVLSLYRKFFERYDTDGMYFDNGPLRICENPNHAGCSFVDEYGITHPTYPWFDVREVKKEIYRMLKRRKPQGVIVDHLSMSPLLPLASFCDAYVDGEQFYNETFTGDYLGSTALEKVRAELMGRQFGLVDFFLPELHGEQAIRPEPTKNLMAMVLLHDMNLWMTFCNPDEVRKAWDAVDRFGIADARFYPYWSSIPAVKATPESIKVSAYLKSGTDALLVAANISDSAVEAVLTLRPAILALPDSGIAAEDGVTSEPLVINGNSLTLRVEPKDYRLVRLHVQ